MFSQQGTLVEEISLVFLFKFHEYGSLCFVNIAPNLKRCSSKFPFLVWKVRGKFNCLVLQTFQRETSIKEKFIELFLSSHSSSASSFAFIHGDILGRRQINSWCREHLFLSPTLQKGCIWWYNKIQKSILLVVDLLKGEHCILYITQLESCCTKWKQSAEKVEKKKFCDNKKVELEVNSVFFW